MHNLNTNLGPLKCNTSDSFKFKPQENKMVFLNKSHLIAKCKIVLQPDTMERQTTAV